MKAVLIIQARMGSRRLPGKSMMLIDGKPLIKRVVDACKLENEYDLWVATSTNNDCDILCNALDSESIWYKRGPEENVFARFESVLVLKPYETIIRVTADDPCHSIDLIKLGLMKFNDLGLTYFNSRSEKNDLPDGLGFEIFTIDLFKYLKSKYSRDASTQEHVTLRLRDGSVKVRDGTFENNEIEQYIVLGCKLCVDDLSDYYFINQIWAQRPNSNRPDTLRMLERIRNKDVSTL